jgi:hypothetical protein
MSGQIGVDFTIGVTPIGGSTTPSGTTTGSTPTISMPATLPIAANAVITSFVPTQLAPFQFQAMFDGSSYNIILTWNIYRQFWYLSIYSPANVLIVSLPLIGSPPWYNISLTAGYFTSTLIYQPAANQFVVTP